MFQKDFRGKFIAGLAENWEDMTKEEVHRAKETLGKSFNRLEELNDNELFELSQIVDGLFFEKWQEGEFVQFKF